MAAPPEPLRLFEPEQLELAYLPRAGHPAVSAVEASYLEFEPVAGEIAEDGALRLTASERFGLRL